MTASPILHCRQFGTGQRTALAIHCSLAQGGAWRDVGQHLSDEVTLTAIDLPGHGKSADWDGAIDLYTVCTQAVAPYLYEPTDLIGHSFGATVALRLAVENPEKIRSLTLIEPVLFAAAKTIDPGALERHLAKLQPFLEAIAQKDMPRAAERFNLIWGAGVAWSDLSEKSRQYITRRIHLVPAQDAALFADQAGLLASGRLEHADIPSLLIAGSQSPPITKTINSALAKRLPHVREVIIPGAGHMVPMTHSGAVADAILNLLEVT